MKFQVIKIIVSLVVILTITGCGATLRDQTPLQPVPLPELENGRFMFNVPPSVMIGDYSDSRPESYIAKSYSDVSEPETPVQNEVRDVLKRLFTKLGFDVSEGAPVELRGEVKKWVVNITAGFPARLEAEAMISVEVYDPANRKIYIGTYQGYARLERVGVETKDLQLALNYAMTEALTRVANDKKLISTVSSF